MSECVPTVEELIIEHIIGDGTVDGLKLAERLHTALARVAEADVVMRQHYASLKEATAEIERLRAGLREIARCGGYRCGAVARRLLGEEP